MTRATGRNFPNFMGIRFDSPRQNHHLREMQREMDGLAAGLTPLQIEEREAAWRAAEGR